MSRALGVLTVDLVLKLGGFEEGLDRAGRAVERTEAEMRKLARIGKDLESSLITPLERLQKETAAYDVLLKQNAITQETYNRAIKQATDVFNASDAAQKEHNALMAQGRNLTQSLITPQERLTQELSQYDKLLEASAIDQRTFNRAVADAQARFKGAGAGGFSEFGKQLSRVRGLLLGFGVGFSLTTVISELKEAGKEALDFGDAMEKAQLKTGAGAVELQELAFAAQQVDVDFDEVTTSLVRMQRVISEALSGSNKQAIATFKELGISLDELRGLNAAERFKVIAEALSQFSDEADIAALGTDVFGRGVERLIPLLVKGAGGIDAFADKAHDLNLILSPEQVKALADAEQSLKTLGAAYDAATRGAAALVAQPLTEFFEAVTIAIANNSKALQEGKGIAEGWSRVMEARTEAINHSREIYIQRVLEAAEAEGLMTKAVLISEAILDTQVTTADDVADAYRRLAQAADEAAKFQKKLAESGGDRRLAALSRTPSAPSAAGTRTRTGGGDEAGKEAEQAQKAVESFIASLEREQATLGATTAEAQRYSVEHGEIAEALKKLGPEADALRAKLLNLIDIGEQQAATKAIEDQIKALRDETAQVGLTEEQLFEYQLRQAAIEGQLGKTAESQARLTAEWRDAWQDMRAAVDQASIVDALGDIDREMLELMGRTTEAAVAEQEERFKKLREAAEAEIARGGPKAEEARKLLIRIEARIDIAGFQAQAEEFRKEVEKIREEFGRREQTIQARIDAGTVSEIGGRRELIELHQKEAAELEEVAKKYDGVADAARAAGTPIPEMEEDVRDLQATIEDLKTTTDEFGKIMADAFETGLSDALGDLAKGVKSLSDAADDFLRSITDSLLEWASQQVASQLRDIIFGGINTEGGFETGSLLTGLGGLARNIFPASAPATTGGGLSEVAITAQRLPEVGAEAAGTAELMAAAVQLQLGATTLTTGATTFTTGATAFVTGTTTLVTAGASLTAAAAALTAAAATLGASGAAGGLEEIIITATRLAGGGPVAGPRGVDKVPAWLTAGEFVVKAEAVQRPGVQTLLERINEGRTTFQLPPFTAPKFADGGLVQATTDPAAGRLTLLIPQPPASERERTVVQQSITVNTPTGNISKQTELQLTAAAARGVRTADRRNN